MVRAVQWGEGEVDGVEQGQVEVRWVAVTPANAAVAEAAAADGVFDERERQQSAAFRRAEDRALYQVAHLALRRLLAERSGRRPEEVVFRRAPCPGCGELHGRPELAQAPGLEFSLSHSGGLALIALAADPIGADVELGGAFAPGAGAEVVTQLHPAERAELAELAERRPDRWTAGALRCWVRKEAYLKGTGMGLGQGWTRTTWAWDPGSTWRRRVANGRRRAGSCERSRCRPGTTRRSRCACRPGWRGVGPGAVGGAVGGGAVSR